MLIASVKRLRTGTLGGRGACSPYCPDSACVYILVSLRSYLGELSKKAVLDQDLLLNKTVSD